MNKLYSPYMLSLVSISPNFYNFPLSLASHQVMFGGGGGDRVGMAQW